MKRLEDKLRYVFVSDKNGERFVPENEYCISPFDHGLLYGDGVFEGIRVYGPPDVESPRIFKLNEHIDRLYNSAAEIGLKIPYEEEEFKQKIVEICKKNELSSGYIRPVVTRGIGDLGLNPKKCPKPTVIIIASEIQLYPKELYEKGLTAAIVQTARVPVRSLSPNVKSLNYLNNIQALREASAVNANEAIMLDHDGYIAEGSADNFFMVSKGRVYTPTERNCLKGITRSVVKEICLNKKISFFETDIHPKDLAEKADECFLTGTAAEIIPITKIIGAPVGGNKADLLTIGDGKPGPITKKLMSLFKEYVRDPKNSTPIY
ncbi:MAG: branched-chain-amino-acid transaminase [Candidatus Nanoarchaeia archaeon]